MKKLIAILAASMLLTGAFASCGKDSDSSEDTTEKAKSSLAADDDDDNDNDADDDDDDDDDDEEDTTSTTKSKKTTKKTTTSKVTTEKATEKATEKPVTPAGDSQIVGKWSMPEEFFDEFDMDLSDIPEGMEFKEMYIECTEKSKMKVFVSVDMSGLMYIDDSGLYMGGVNIPDSMITNYGDSLMISVGDQENIIFDRIGDPDSSSMYGRYTADSMFGSTDKDVEYVLDFSAPKKSFMEVKGDVGTYSFDESTGKLSLDDRAETVDVEFKGNTMTWTNDDGEKVNFERIG